MKKIYEVVSEDDIQNIRDMYIKNKTAKEIKKVYSNLSERSIIRIVRDGGIPINHVQRCHFIKNEDFFETIDSPDKAYILGFLISDGYVIYPKGKNPNWGIELQEQDKYILEKIKEIVGVNKKIVVRNRDGKRQYILSVASKKMVEDLSKYGVVPRKSRTARLPRINDEYMCDLIRGIFDGDGCIAKSGVCSFCGNKYFIQDIKDFLVENVHIANNKLSNRKNSNINPEYMDVYAFYFSSKEDKRKFYDYIYKSESKLYLKRKKEKFETFLY